MTRREYRATLWGVASLAAGLLLTELLAFRLSAATMGYRFALFAALLLPSAGALGAMALAWRSASASAAQLGRSAAHLAGLAGTLALAGTIGLTWASQKIARAGGEATTLQLLVALASCLLPAVFAAGSLGIALRRGLSHIGRLTFAEAFGAATACVLAPLMMAFGAPRASLLAAMLFALGALAFGSVAQEAHPRMSALATLPLAVLALLAGDLGAPWLKMRTDTGRRTRVAELVWTTQGVIAVAKVKRGKTSLAVDGGSSVPLAYKLKEKQKPRFEPQDLVFVSKSAERGPVLLVGSAGAREVAVARSYGHPRVDLVELSGTLVGEVLMNRYAEVTDRVLHDSERVQVHIGDGRAGIDALPADYQYVLLLARPELSQAAPRLLSRQDRLYTSSAISAYMARLRDDGALLISGPRAALPAIMAAVVEATGEPVEVARKRMLVCSWKAETVLLVDRAPITPSRLHKLEKRCNKSKLEVEFPMRSPKGKRGRKQLAEQVEQQEVRLAWLDAGQPLADDRPFLEPAHWQPLGASLRALRPSKPAAAPELEKKEVKPAASSLLNAKEASGKGADPAAGDLPASTAATAASVAAAAAILAALALLIGLLVPPPRRQRRDGKRAPLSWALRLSFPFLGSGLALCMFSLGESLLRLLGDGAYSWTVVIPMGLVGAGGGRLWLDVVRPEALRRRLPFAIAAAIAWLLLLVLLVPRSGALAGASPWLLWSVVGALLLASGAALGMPLAAGLRLLGRHDPAPAAWCWGAHLGGWALGGALAAWLVHHVGIAQLLPIGVASFVAGALLLALGGRRPAPPAAEAAWSPLESAPPAQQ